MAFLSIPNVSIAGVSAAVPNQLEENKNLSLFSPEECEKFIAATGVERRHISKVLLSSDLCCAAAEKLLADLNWEKGTVDGLVVVTQSPDYQRPGNGTILQDRLGLSTECLAVSVSFGCSGWVYGLSTAASLLQCGCKRVLLCCGEGNQAYHPEDKSTYPLFGSAGTCTALEFDPSAAAMNFHLATDGSGWKAIHIPEGAYRHPATTDSFRVREDAPGARRTALNTSLDGMDVFMFGISQPPKSIQTLCKHFETPLESFDFLLLHQANLFLNGKIQKKLKIAPEKVPHNIEHYGNTSSASLPLLMVTRMKEDLVSRPMSLLGCAFGVGLSWGSVAFETKKPVVSDLVYVEDSYAASV